MADLVFVSNTKTASIEAALLGVPIVVNLDPDGFNMSPLRGHADVMFASSPDDLVRAMRLPRRARVPADYF